MKKMLNNIFSTTGICIVVIALTGLCYGGSLICISTILSVLGANILIHLGMLLTRRFESDYAILEYLLDFAYIAVIIVSFGAVFQWFESLPIWMTLIIGAAVYAICILLDQIRVRQDMNEINAILLERKHHQTDLVP
ncbi:MAG: hypothetical protein Q4G60_14470 [bacterium]|nr:hypothetical protein [bacterium]